MASLSVRGRRAVVTGGAAGIGGAVAARLAASGASVLIADVDEAAAVGMAARLGARHVVADLSTLDGVRATISAGVRVLGGLDVLVNNAGGVVEPRYPAAPDEHWMRMLDLNLRGVMLATRLAIEVMPRGGAVVNVASSAGLGFGVHGVPEYAVAKAGVMRLTACLAPLRESHGIRVNCVCPDLTDTPSSRRGRAGMTAEELAAEPPPMPAEEVADAVAMLLSDETLAGRVVMCRAEHPRRVLLPADPWPDYVARLTGGADGRPPVAAP
jgi:NAD(P)-dependent dehydrogenase (short-subunit alcohol dehydrogenase family)